MTRLKFINFNQANADLAVCSCLAEKHISEPSRDILMFDGYTITYNVYQTHVEKVIRYYNKNV